MKDLILKLVATNSGWIARQLIKWTAVLTALIATHLSAKGLSADQSMVIATATASVVFGIVEFALSYIAKSYSVPEAEGLKMDIEKLRKTGNLLVACLAVLSLSSCAATTAFLASPFGQAVEASAISLGKQLAKEVELQGIAAVIDKATAKIAAIKAEPLPTTTLALIERGGELSMLNAVIAAAQTRYKERAGHSYIPDKNPTVSITP